MTKELVKSENGHKIIKHAKHEALHSRFSCHRIKMRFATPCLVIIFLAVASADSPVDQRSASDKESEKTTENGKLTSSASTDKTVFTNNDMPNGIRIEKLKANDGSDLAPDMDVAMDDLLLFETFINDNKMMKENQNLVSSRVKNENLGSIADNSENPIESKLSTDFVQIRRQGEQNPEVKLGASGPDTQFDDSKQEVVSDNPPRYGQRKSKQKVHDGAPFLQLTQGGYDRPFKRPRFRNRYASRPDSSEQSSQVQEPDKNSNDNRQPETRQIVPQVAYSPSPQSPHALRPRPILNPGFETPARNMMAIHHIVPTTIQSRFFNTPSTGFADYTTVPFQAQFPQSNDVGGFPNFGRDLSNAALYQSSQRNPFQTPGLLLQNTPEVQTQPIVIDPVRNVQPQYQQNPFIPYRGFESEDSSRPNYAPYFRNPTVNTQFQVPQNFYTTTPNGLNAFNSPPINFLSNYPNSDDTLSPRFFRYPVAPGEQNNQQNSNDQQLDSDASQEDKNAKVERQEVINPGNRVGSTSVPFGFRLQAQNEADVFMRYPTNEAGYATEENLPAQNISDEIKDNSQQTNSEQRIFPGADSFRNALNSARTNQGINNSFGFPPELFRDAPIDFGYQRPQNQIFIPYADRDREITRYPNSNFESRNPFDTITSLPENNYQFLNVDNQRRGHRESSGTPSCAKHSNASVCFEDSEYPRNDILYSLNSNSFLADRLSGQDLLLNSVVFVERNVTGFDQTPENYACETITKYGSPLRAKNLEGVWRIIVNVEGKFSQPVRMEVCKSLGDPCSYVDSRIKTTCVQKYSMQRLLSWSPGRGIYSDVYKMPVACSCQILQVAET